MAVDLVKASKAFHEPIEVKTFYAIAIAAGVKMAAWGGPF